MTELIKGMIARLRASVNEGMSDGVDTEWLSEIVSHYVSVSKWYDYVSVSKWYDCVSVSKWYDCVSVSKWYDYVSVSKWYDCVSVSKWYDYVSVSKWLSQRNAVYRPYIETRPVYESESVNKVRSYLLYLNKRQLWWIVGCNTISFD